jgi:hypothetical protein
MDACIKDGNFIDAAFTYNYSAAGTAHNDRVRYEAFCYRAWSLVDFIVRRGLENEKLYDAIISWIVAFHRTWLERNPFMFASGDFWRVYDEVRSKPLMVFQSYRLPHRADAIEDRTDAVDWDKVSEDYHNLVLGPWHPDMMACDPKNPKKRRNFLLDELNNYQAESGNKPLKILDFGCGPGNILDYLQESQIREVKEIFGLDSSAKALRIAEKKGQRVGASFCSGERRHARLLGD